MYTDNDRNLKYRYAHFSTISKTIYWWYEEKTLHDGLIDYACIDDVIIPEPFGYSYIFQKKDTLYQGLLCRFMFYFTAHWAGKV